MKKITKLLLMTAIAIGMVACSNDDNLPDAPDANAAKGNTYASISIKLPKGPSTRALPGDYNDKGTWKGIDDIKTINVYLVNEASGAIDKATFVTGSFEGIDSQGILYPNVALKATAGLKVKAYVVLNGNADVINSLNAAPTPTAFNAIYATEVKKNASVLASNVDTKDVIMMTNTVAPAEMTVIAGVTESEAMTGSGNNTFMVEVERVVSRAIVTAKEAAKTAEIKVQNAQGTDASTITIKDLKYVVGQSNKQFYMIKRDNYVTPDPVYSHVPSATTSWASTIFDNEGLGKLSEVITATGADLLSKFEDALTGEGVNSKFVLPVTHATADYRKGNTTYFEVTAIFTPNAVDGGDYTAGADVFLGMKDGLFYSTRALAEAEGQKATHYKGDTSTGAIMKYVLWLNPDKIPGATTDKATMSPTVRNQVYHAHINSFKKIGLPNNPLNPDDPNNPQVDPDDPTKPMDPTDPGYDPNIPGNENPINPIKPEDPLQTEDTYLSVQITVLPWGMHSYQIDLGNDY